MRVLVTGGAGYIGSVTSRLLLDEGHGVVVLDNLERGHRAAVDPRAELIEADLRDRDATLDAIRRAAPEAVVHFAAYAYVGESMEAPTRYLLNNVGGGIHLLEAMVKTGVHRIVFSSSCATYGEPDVLPIDESAAQRPTSPYGSTKLMFEQMLSWCQRAHGFAPVCLRYFNAAGASGELGEDHDPETHLIPLVLQVALGQRGAITVFGTDYATPDGSCIRDYIHIEDLARAHVLALASGFSGALNLGTGSGNSVLEVIETARRVTGHAIPARPSARRPGDPPRLVAAAGKAGEEIGWRPQCCSLDQIVEDAWEWHRRHPGGYTP